MTELYTSYWNKPALKNLPFNEALKIGISRWRPHWVKSEDLGQEPFAPSEHLLSWWKGSEQKVEDRAYFEREYRAALDAAGIEQVAADLREKFADHNGTVILLCHEKTGKFCHRRTFADWWQEQTGQEILELA